MVSQRLFCVCPNMDMESQKLLHGAAENNEQGLEKDDLLKRRISSHPLYELLVQFHLQCLKVGEISNLEMDQKLIMNKQSSDMFSEPELDLFMEAYCMALGELKESMEETQQKVMAFINNMHSQLKELSVKTALPPDDASPTTYSAHSSSILQND